MLRDLAFDFLHFAALPSKDAANIELGLSTFKGEDSIEPFHADAASELKLAAENLGIPADESTPYEHQGNGHIEVFIKLLKWGARSCLLHSGMGHKWWPWAASHWVFVWNLLTAGPMIFVLFRQKYDSKHLAQLWKLFLDKSILQAKKST